ncbi:MAG TPA: nucleotidyltransferase domain-containing protein, partial [Thermoanaerobaculia bacterium]
MGIEEILGSKREEILRIAERHGVTSIRVFGSVARGEAGSQSDVDFLVEVGPNRTPWFP